MKIAASSRSHANACASARVLVTTGRYETANGPRIYISLVQSRDRNLRSGALAQALAPCRPSVHAGNGYVRNDFQAFKRDLRPCSLARRGTCELNDTSAPLSVAAHVRLRAAIAHDISGGGDAVSGATSAHPGSTNPGTQAAGNQQMFRIFSSGQSGQAVACLALATGSNLLTSANGGFTHAWKR